MDYTYMKIKIESWLKISPPRLLRDNRLTDGWFMTMLWQITTDKTVYNGSATSVSKIILFLKSHQSGVYSE